MRLPKPARIDKTTMKELTKNIQFNKYLGIE